MVVETKSTIKRCDCCNVVIPERSAFLNDGSFQSDSLDIGDVNVCVECCGKIMIRFMSESIDEKQLLKWATHKSIQRNPYVVRPMDISFKWDRSYRDEKQDGSILNTPVIT